MRDVHPHGNGHDQKYSSIEWKAMWVYSHLSKPFQESDSDTTDSDATIDVIAPKKLLNTLYA